MIRSSLRLLLVAALGLSAACDSDKPVARGAEDARYAIRHSDYMAGTSVSLLAADGSVIVDDFINSGTVAPGLTLAFGDDTAFPSAMEPGILTIIDRYGSDVVTRIRLSDATVLPQVRTHGTSDSGFSSNPNDVLYVDATHAWVTRYSANTQAGVAADVRGSDLYSFDPSTGTLGTDRVDFSSLEYDLGDGRSMRARPNRIVRVGDYAVVGLDLLSDFRYPDPTVAGAAKLAIVDLTDGTFSTWDIPGGLVNCGGISLVPGTTDRVAIPCLGGFVDRIADSGVVVVSVDEASGAVTELGRYASADHASDPYVLDAVVVVDEDEFIGTTLGGYDETDPPDVLVHVNLTTGARATIATSAAGSQFFTTGAFDDENDLLLVPDTSLGVRRFTRGSDGTFTEGAVIELFGHGLPARSVAILP